MPRVLFRPHDSSSWSSSIDAYEGEELECPKRFDPFELEPDGAGDGEEVVADSGDEEMAEMVKCLGKRKKKKVAPSHIAAVALKNHREAERRRRERINAHLATLRALLPSNNPKMDKATLLGEVINGVKDLQEHARRVSQGLLMPMDADEITVEPLCNESENEAVTFKASLCCDLRPDLFSDLRQAIGSLRLKTLDSKISTLGERVKTVFILSSHGAQNVNDAEAQKKNLANAILQALSSVLYKPSALPEYSLRTTLSQKRFIASSEDSSSPRSVMSPKRFKYSFFGSSSSSA